MTCRRISFLPSNFAQRCVEHLCMWHFCFSMSTIYFRFACTCQDLETMLSSAERTPRPPKPPVLLDILLHQYGNTLNFPVDVVTISQFPRRAPHKKLQQSVKPAAKLISASPTHDDRTKRIMREVCRCYSKAPRLLDFPSVESPHNGSTPTDRSLRERQ
jgi:hypothetical protein